MRTPLLRRLAVLLFLFGFGQISAQIADYTKLSLRLSDLTATQPDSKQPVRIGIELEANFDLKALDQQLYSEGALPEQRVPTVINALKASANANQPAFIQFMASTRGVRLSTAERFWISNLIFVDATPQAILQLSLHPEVRFIDLDAQLALDEPIVEPPLPMNGARMNSVNGHEPGHDAIGAPAMWAMGYTGLGRLAMSMDAGVDDNHPALSWKWQGNFKPLEQSWFAYNTPGSTPFDCDGNSSHGTHTMGTICGWDPATNDTIGVAPNARWVHSPSLCVAGGTSSNVAGFQWSMDPDNNPNTTADMPDVINNSWFDPGTTNECNGLYRSTLDAVEAAGIAVVFSAGNSGSNSSTITQPKNINNDTVSVFCVGATQINPPYNIAGFSSRGPSDCGGSGSLNIKPEVSAPGVGVRSSQGASGYGNLSGTSMAAPHASGAIILLKEAFPQLTGRQLKLAIYYSATDLGAAGEDNTYGMGMVNVPAAYNWLLSQGHIPAAYNYDAGLSALNSPTPTTCDQNIAPEVQVYNDGNSVLTSLTIEYTIVPGNITNTFTWTGSLAPGNSTAITLPAATLTPGNYTLTITTSQPNGQADERAYNDCLIRELTVQQGTQIPGASLNCPGVAQLNANAGANTSVTWFAAPTGGTALGTGNTFTTPSLNGNATYYAELITTDNGAKATNTGGGGYFANDNRWLIFDALSDFTLNSVLVYANSAGNRTIQLRDATNSTIYSTTVNVPNGQSRVNLNWAIPTGNSYVLRLNGNADLYRNNNGLNYPYTLPGVFSVTSSNASNPTGFYYFFYDWEVEYADACGRVPVAVTVGQYATSIVPSATQVNLNISGTVNFTGTTTPANVATYAWDFGDGGSSTAANPSHTYTTPGTYTVTLTVSDGSGCTATDTVVITVAQPVGIEALPGHFQALDLYPNPTAGQLRIALQLDAEWPVQVELFNALGERVLGFDAGTVQNLEAELDLAPVATGLYYLQLTAGEERLVRRVARQ
ncbi:MAG: S8 family serine peptidase [Bacteroidota bacterium]